MPIVDTIFFDVDGTLVDARSDIVNAVNHALHSLGLEEKQPEEIVSYIGTGVKDLARKSLGKKNERLLEKAIKIFSDYYSRHSFENSTVYPHVVEVLEYFNKKNKHILTNRYSKFADITLAGLGIRKYFKEIIGGDDEECLKPSACVLDAFFAKSGIDRNRSIIVGDMAIDIMTGKNSKVKTCWVTYGLGRAGDVMPLKPDFVLDDIIGLKKIIE